MFSDQRPIDALTLRLSEVGRGFRLGEHFVLAELACRDGADEVLVHPALVVALNRLRREIGGPLIVNSGYRTVSHNRAVGGAARSYHLLGMAADVRTASLTPRQLGDVAERLGLGGIGIYPTFTHLDVGPKRRF